MAALLLRNLSSTCVRVSPARDASRLSSKQSNQPRFFPGGARSARRPLNNAVVSRSIRITASSSSSAQQSAVPTGMGAVGAGLGGSWQMGGGDGFGIVDEGGRTWTREEIHEDFLKLSAGLDSALAALSQPEHSHSYTSPACDNSVTDASAPLFPRLAEIYRGLNERNHQMQEEGLLELKDAVDMSIALFFLTNSVEPDDSPQVCLNKAVQEYHRRRAQGIPADVATFIALFTMSWQVDHKTTLELYALMRKEGLQLDGSITQLLFLSACLAGDMSSLKPIVREVDGVVDEGSYSSSSIELYHILINQGGNGSQENLELAWRFYEGMEADKIARPNAETFNILIKVNLQAGDHEGALRAYKLMSANGFARDLTPEFWNKLIHAVAAVPSAPAYVAYGCYDALQTWGPKPDLETCQGLIAVCARDGDAARAMALRREMEDGGVEVTGAVLRALIGMQRQAGLWEAAVETYREMQAKAVLSTDDDAAWGREFLKEATEKVRPNAKTFNLLIEASVEAGDHSGAVRAYKLMAASGLAHELNPVFWSKLTQFVKTVIAQSSPAADAANEAGTSPPVLQLLSEAAVSESGCVDPDVFNLLIETSLQAGDHSGALRAYKLMSANGLASDLNPPFWNKLIHAVVAVPSAPAYVAYGCYDGMKRWGPKPDSETYLGLMAVCARDGDAARAMALKKDMEDGAWMQRKAGMSEAAAEILKEMQAKAVVSTDEGKAWGHELLMEAIEKGDAAGVMALKKDMEDGGVEVTLEVLRALLTMQRNAGQWEAAVETYREMQAKGISLTNEDTAWGRELLMEAIEKGSPDAETFNLAIASSLRAGDHEGVLQAYKLMSASGFARDLTPEFWNKLIHSVAAVPSAPAYVAYGCYDGMQRWGPEPDLETYTGLMAVCARDGDAARAMALRREMEDEGLEVTAAVYSTLIRAQGKAGEWEEAVGTFREMQGSAKGEIDHPLHPSADTYNLLFDACFGPEGADAVIQDMVNQSQSLKFTPALQAAVSIFREAAAEGAFPPALTADPFTCFVVDCTPPVAAVALLSLLLRLASSSITGSDAVPLRNLLIVAATLQAQATDEAPPQEELASKLHGTMQGSARIDACGKMEALLQAIGLKGERLHGTSTLQGLCVDREDLRLWLKSQAASVFLA